MTRISTAARPGSRPMWTGPTQGIAALCFGIVFSALPAGEAIAALMGGGIIPPNTSQSASKPSNTGAAAKPVKAAAPLAASATKGMAAAAAAVAAKVAPAAKAAAAQPARTPITAPGPRIGGPGGLNGQIPRSPSIATTRPPEQPAKAAGAASPAPLAVAAPPPPAPTASTGHGSADRPAPATAAAAKPAAPPSAAASGTSANVGLGNPVRTEYIKGSDGHEITINYFRNRDGTLLKTAVSPAAFPPPNASPPQPAPSRAQQAQRPAGAAPAKSTGEAGGGPATAASAGSGSVRNTAASEPVKLAYAPGSSAIDPSTGKSVVPDVVPRGQIPHGPAGQQRNPDSGSITVMVPDASADQSRAGAPAAQPPRQGMDVIDRSIGEFDATRPALGAAPKDPAADAPARRASGQTQSAKAASPRPVAQAGDDEYATDPPRNRRPRQARTASTRAVAAAPGNPVQPLIFGRVTRASFALARLQGDTLTRGLRIAETPLPATTAPRRPGEVSGRGIAQTADLGRGSPAYGAAADVFASASEATKTPPVACKARAPSRHAAARRAEQARATACS